MNNVKDLPLVHVMLDLETLALTADAVVCSIGACVFDARRHSPSANYSEPFNYPPNKFYATLNRDQQIKNGRRVLASTLDWWMSPDRAEARKLFENKDAASQGITSQLLEFQRWLNSLCIDPKRQLRIYGNGANFDNPMIDSLYEQFGIDAPWNPFAHRCYRTLKGLAPSIKLARVGTYHNALDDAISQANHLKAIINHTGIEIA